MEPAMDLMQLNGLIRKAINLVTGVQIHVSKDVFEFAVTSVIPGFKVYFFQRFKTIIGADLPRVLPANRTRS